MSNVKTIEIQCTECKTWFRSPMFFGNMESFDSSLILGNKVNCPNCQRMVGCDKENMRVRSEDGGFSGIDTVR